MRFNINFLTRTALFLALTLAVQGLRLPSLFTGPAVNFFLALATVHIGMGSGAFIGLLTPWAALLLGILPAPLAPAIPFIMLGNAAYALLIGLFDRSLPARAGQFTGVAAGSAIKFSIIAGAATHIIALPPPVTGALLLPQLYNALLGGVLAIVIGTLLPPKIKEN